MKTDFRYYLENFFKENKIPKISNGLITIILCSIIILIINLLFFTPEIHGYDEMAKWSAGKKFQENFEINTQHHSMRWGAWITTLFFQSLENAPLAYYIHNLLVLHISLIIFAYIILQLAGIIPSVVFLFITHYYKWILWSGFQADISISTFLPLSLIILLIQKNILGEAVDSKQYFKKNLHFSFFTLICFYLYAVKETNLFFIPGILYFIFIYYGPKACIKFITIFFIFYSLETIALKHFVSGNFSNYGRIFQLIFGGTTQSIKTFFTGIINNLTILELITRRWQHNDSMWFYLINFIIFFYIFISNFNRKYKKKIIIFTALTILSFYFFHTFFIISLSPLLPGNDFIERYNHVIFPVCTGSISIIVYKIFYLKKFRLIKIFSMLIFLYLIAPTVKHTIIAHSLLVRHIETDEKLNNIFIYDSIFSRVNYYNKLKKIIKNQDYCFSSKLHPRLLAVPFILGYVEYKGGPTDEIRISNHFFHSYNKPISECKNFINLDVNSN
jgi:hypothetical protein